MGMQEEQVRDKQRQAGKNKVKSDHDTPANCVYQAPE